jgi:hypothetical protein
MLEIEDNEAFCGAHLDFMLQAARVFEAVAESP